MIFMTVKAKMVLKIRRRLKKCRGFYNTSLPHSKNYSQSESRKWLPDDSVKQVLTILLKLLVFAASLLIPVTMAFLIRCTFGDVPQIFLSAEFSPVAQSLFAMNCR